METRSDRINFLLADLYYDDRERIKVGIRNLAADTLQRREDRDQHDQPNDG